MGSFQQLRAFSALSIGALAANDVVSGGVGPLLEEDYRVTSMDGVWSIIGAVNEGPLVFGVAHGDYTAAEIEECLEASLTRPGDKIAKEQANRLVRTIGVLNNEQVPDIFNEGQAVKVKLNWALDGDADGVQGIQMWVHSLFSGTLTTGQLLKFQGVLNGFWI